MSDTFDPKKVKPKDGWALLLADERSGVLSSGLIVPIETGVEKVTELAGELVRLGDGIYNANLREVGLVEGVRVLFRGYLKFANPLPTDEKWPSGSAKQYFFIDCKDIMGIVAPGVSVGVFSGRPTVPHVQPKQE